MILVDDIARWGGEKTIICECGEIIEGSTFRDYIRTSANPSTSTIGHKKCGHIFNFIDGRMSKKYSSRIELKSLAVRFAEKNNMDGLKCERFLIEVDRLKSNGNLSDRDILIRAFHNL
ncbi:MAG: hypothetical protein OIN88_08465 [Candidatus Methanoperedens sp.]|nr:hypothetical protein [Candidatus Methanoperedens sp.]MCZ7358926.1 hypothetical protein [Candidatus Methanoperedens sp.]HLB70570.1 hypothetical protein [Candidatus Methanoperedens sp.]